MADVSELALTLQIKINSDLLQQLEGFEELINSGRAMIDGKGWHEIDSQCSICQRFIAAIKAAEQSMHPTLLQSASLEALSKPENSATSQTDQTPQQRG